MDLDELVRNIETARDAAKKEAEQFRRRAEEIKASGGQNADRVNLGINIVAALAVEAALSRILGDVRPVSDPQ